MTAKALFDWGFPTALSDSQATALGLKRYAHGTSYNSGINPTVTLNSGGGTLSSVALADFIPYQMSDGTWRMKLNIDVTVSSTSRTGAQLGINGVAFFVSNAGQSISGSPYDATTILAAYAGVSSAIVFAHSSATTTGYFASGDVRLASKPTWAY